MLPMISVNANCMGGVMCTHNQKMGRRHVLQSQEEIGGAKPRPLPPGACSHRADRAMVPTHGQASNQTPAPCLTLQPPSMTDHPPVLRRQRSCSSGTLKLPRSRPPCPPHRPLPPIPCARWGRGCCRGMAGHEAQVIGRAGWELGVGSCDRGQVTGHEVGIICNPLAKLKSIRLTCRQLSFLMLPHQDAPDQLPHHNAHSDELRARACRIPETSRDMRSAMHNVEGVGTEAFVSPCQLRRFGLGQQPLCLSSAPCMVLPSDLRCLALHPQPAHAHAFCPLPLPVMNTQLSSARDRICSSNSNSITGQSCAVNSLGKSVEYSRGYDEPSILFAKAAAKQGRAPPQVLKSGNPITPPPPPAHPIHTLLLAPHLHQHGRAHKHHCAALP